MAPEPAGAQRGPSSTSHPDRTMGLPVLEIVLFFPKGLFFSKFNTECGLQLGSWTWTLMLILYWQHTVLVILRVPFACWLLHVGCGWSPKWQRLLLPKMVVWLQHPQGKKMCSVNYHEQSWWETPSSALCVQVLILHSTKTLWAGWGIHLDSFRTQGKKQKSLEGDSAHHKTW